MSASEKKLLNASFAGWKLDLIKALCSDKALLPADVRVALAILQHLNVGSYTAYPKHDTIAEIACMSDRNVRNSLQRLRLNGWLQWEQANRRESSVYEFIADKIADEIARMKRDEERRRKSKTNRPSPRHDRKRISGQKPVLTGTTVPPVTGTTVPPNTYREKGCSTEGLVGEGALND